MNALHDAFVLLYHTFLAFQSISCTASFKLTAALSKSHFEHSVSRETMHGQQAF